MENIKIPKDLTWNLKPLFKSDSDPNIKKDLAATERSVKRFVKKWKNRKDYLKNPKILRKALDDYEKLWREYGNSGKAEYYFWLRTMQEQSNPKLKAKYGQVSELSKKLWNEMQFFNLQIGKIEHRLQKRFLKSKDLEPYHHYLERNFRDAKYKMGEQEEKIMVLKHGPSHENWMRMVEDLLSREEREVLDDRGKKKTKPFSEIKNLTGHENKKIRDVAARAFNEILAKHVDVAEFEINSILQNHKINDDLRGRSRPDLVRHVSDDMESKDVDILVDVVSANFSITKRYNKLKAKLMGVKETNYYERDVEYGSIDEKYTFKKTADLIHQTLLNLDGDFAKIFSNFVQKRQIDVLPRKGKRGGAFCAYNLIVQPVYILLNHQDDLKGVRTLAHETGHGINNELMRNRQNSLNFGTPMSTAEVASTFMEDFVLDEAVKEADDETRLVIMMKRLQDATATIFRQIAAYKFEQELHSRFREKGYLSKDEIGKLFVKHMRAYMGPSVNFPKGSENLWVYWSHFRYLFYVYSYAGGLLISKALQRKVKENPEFIKKVKEFLSAGGSDSPKNIFKKLGIDISKKTFWENGIAEVEQLLRETEKLAKKLGKI